MTARSLRLRAAVTSACFAATVPWPAAAAESAAAYPSRPIRFIVPYPSGGGADTIARVVAGRLTENIGQQIIIDKGGGPALNDLLGGQIQLMGGPMVAALPLVRARKVKALAVTTAKRVSSLPDIPTVGETLPGYQSSGWAGVLVTKGTPSSLIERLNAEIAKAVQHREVRRQLGEQGSEPVSSAPAAFAALIARDMVAYRELLKAAGMHKDKGGAAAM